MGNAPMIMMMVSNIIIMFMIMLMIIIEKNVGVLVVDAVSWNEDETIRVYLEREARIKAISGEDDSEKNEALVLERFRVLLGLSKLKRTHVKPSREEWGNGSPAPAPLPSTLEAEGEGPAPAPAPAPIVPASAAHVKPHHHQPPRPHPVLPIQRLGHHHKENSKRKRIMVAAIVSTGVAMLICACGVMWASKRMYKQQKGASKGATLCGEKSAQNLALASKVRDDPGFGLCYPTNTATSVLELEQAACVKGTYDSLNTTVGSVNSATYETKDLGDEETKGGPRESNCSFSAEEIISVHEYAESSKYESDGQNSSNADNIVGNDNHASEDESFHSLSDSHSSSNLRLSNVSLGSFSEPVEHFSPNQSNRSPSSPPTIETATFDTASSVDLPSNPPRCPLAKRNPTTSLTNIPNCPPPPPPPPPTPFTSIAPSRPTSTAQPASKPSQSPRRVQNVSSGANHTLRDNLCSPSTTSKTTEARSNIPPPPCPPPFPNKKGTPLKGPPPPPGQPPSFTPLGKDGTPLPKLKPLHWDKVRAAPDRSMVWDKLRCNSFELDEEMIESLFGYNLQTAFKNQEGTSKSPSPSKHVLEPKRLQNITILSKALNVTAEKVCEALVQGDGLGSQQLEALVKMAPTKEEEAKLTSYKGDINELGSAEKLVKKMLIIPHAFRRIEAMLYRATFDDEVVHLRNSFSMLEEACKELRSSRLFLKLLEAVLKTGNRMNVGTIRGGARAFKLDALLKLADVKGTDGKTTLLHFVVQEIIRSEGIRMSDSIMGQIDRNSKSRTVEEKEDDYRRMGLDLVSGLSTELCNVKRTASIDLDVLATSVSNLSDGLSKLQELINKDMFKDAPNDKFVHAMKTFLNHAEKNLMELRAEEDKVLLSVRQITEYYHGDVSKDEANPLRIFVIVRDFMGMLDQVCRELKTLKTPRTPNPLAPFK